MINSLFVSVIIIFDRLHFLPSSNEEAIYGDDLIVSSVITIILELSKTEGISIHAVTVTLFKFKQGISTDEQHTKKQYL